MERSTGLDLFNQLIYTYITMLCLEEDQILSLKVAAVRKNGKLPILFSKEQSHAPRFITLCDTDIHI